MLKVYSIKDVKVDAFMQPFFLPTDGAALRAFGDEAKNVDSNLAKHPEDYVLYALGIWDDQLGKLQPFDAPRSLGVASEYVGSGLGKLQPSDAPRLLGVASEYVGSGQAA